MKLLLVAVFMVFTFALYAQSAPGTSPVPIQEQAKQQDVKPIPRVSNRTRLARSWNSMNPMIDEWNATMKKASDCLQDRFNSQLLIANPDAKRKECVVYYKLAIQVLHKEELALIDLIEEDDWEARTVEN